MPVYQSRTVDDYESNRVKIQTGDILICSGSSFFSDLIKDATGSPWSHVGLIFRLDTIDRVLVLESVESIGVRAVPLTHYLRNYKGQGKPYPGEVYVARHSQMGPAAQAKIQALAQTSADLLGQPYDSEEIARIAARIASGGVLGKKSPEKNGSYICSEYAAECLSRINIIVKPDKLGFTAPSDFGADPNINNLLK